jgi:alginate O-acetyltransferase complex protein AlgI
MIFSSFEFICIFLPAIIILLLVLNRKNRTAISCVVIIFSLYFYSFSNSFWLFILIFSIIFNFSVGKLLIYRSSNLILFIGVFINLLLLIYFKYTNFFIQNFSDLFSIEYKSLDIILPIGISFFTFQQIAFLVDAKKQKIKNPSFVNYTLFVSFFPQLIAGPIILYGDIIEQLEKKISLRFFSKNFIIGLLIFNIGLFKKLCIADTLELFSNPIFTLAETNQTLTFLESWSGLISYSFQIYFDFSGYSDMAIGLAKIFGITLPINFNSPYKSYSIIEFWKKWHITLSNFFKLYVYFPIGGNKTGVVRQLINIFFVMLLAGFWHGASWNFVVWGGAHGIFIIMNHTWRIVTKGWYEKSFVKYFNLLLTFLCVTLAWAFFRAETVNGALNIISGCFSSININLSLFFNQNQIDYYLPYVYQIKWFVLLFLIVWVFPNTNQILSYLESSNYRKKSITIYKYKIITNNSYIFLVIVSFFLFIASFPSNQLNQPFIYFQF